MESRTIPWLSRRNDCTVACGRDRQERFVADGKAGRLPPSLAGSFRDLDDIDVRPKSRAHPLPAEASGGPTTMMLGSELSSFFATALT